MVALAGAAFRTGTAFWTRLSLIKDKFVSLRCGLQVFSFGLQVS
jgi:hypothetical protein